MQPEQVGTQPAQEPKAAAVQQTPTEGAEPTEGEPKAAPPAPEKQYTQAELDRIVAKVKKNARYSTRREIEAYYAGRGEAAQQRAPQQRVEPAAEERQPVREEFASYEAFIEANAAYAGKKAAREYREQAEQETRREREQQTEVKLFSDFNAKVRDKFPDLEERAEDVAHIQMPPGMGRAIAESDLGPEILDHLIDNAKELERIAALPPSRAIREIGKLEARLEAKQTPAKDAQQQPTEQKAPPPKAPAPIEPGGKQAAPPDDQPTDKDSIDDWMRKERKRMRVQRG